MLSLLFIQAAPMQALTPWQMVVEGTLSTKIVLGILVAFSFGCWAVLVWKFFQFRKMFAQAAHFLDKMEQAERLEDAYNRLIAFPESPFTRVFNRGVTFFSELRPGGLKVDPNARGLSPAQLEVLRLVLEKEEGLERDSLAHGIQWLAIFATVAPLLGLLGTVMGVMNSFIGVAAAGSANISAVAPGVAEALLTTVAGLVVAIPAAIGYNYFAGRLNLFMSELEGFSSEFIGTLAREGKI
jgi:biopolymer transport protein TolQ